MRKWKHVEAEQQYAINIWILNDKVSEQKKVIYGCAVPVAGKVPFKKWFKSKVKNNANFFIENLKCFITGEDTVRFMNMLEESKTFYEISLKISIVSLPNHLKDILLAAEDYRYRAPIFLETREVISYYKDAFQSLSTLAMNPCICESIVNIAKENLILFKGAENEKKLAESIKSVLTAELPLTIPGPDAGRIGNFELFNFAYEKDNDVAPITIEVIKKEESNSFTESIKISIRPGFFKEKVYLRCRVRNGNNIIGDQISLVENAHLANDISYGFYETCSEIEVSVWDAKENDTQAITLLYEDRVSLMREINFAMNVESMQGKIKAPWTEKMLRRNRHENITNEFQRGTRQYSTINNFGKDPWIPASRKMINYFNANYPEKTDAVFFEKGWEDEDKFVKWLQEIVGKSRIARVILVDPFFDTEAVSKFLSLIKFNDVNYEVITDIGIRESKGIEITTACKELKAILPSKINIFGLSRVGGGEGQLFHDRFLILLNENNMPNVYMLSNSISGVAKKFPSVVIPVPNDVGKELMEYYIQLKSGNGKYDILEINKTILWPVENQKKELQRDLILDYQFLREVLFESETTTLEKAQDGFPPATEDKKERELIFEKIGNRIKRLLKEDTNKAIELWVVTAYWRANVEQTFGEEMFNWFDQSKYKSDIILVAKLCIQDGIKNDYPMGVKNIESCARSISIGRQSNLSFVQTKEFASYLFVHGHSSNYPINYAIYMAFEYLLKSEPKLAFESLKYITDIVKEIDDKKKTAEMMSYYIIISTAMDVIIDYLTSHRFQGDFSQTNIGLESESPIIRALHVMNISVYLNSRENLSENIKVYEIIGKLNYLEHNIERIYAFSWIVYDCQVLKRQVKNVEIHGEMIRYIKEKIVDEWPQNSNASFLRSILRNISGPIEGDHSQDTFETLSFLIKNKKISKQEAAEYVKQVLVEKVSMHMNGKKRIFIDVDIPFTHNALISYVNILPDYINDLIYDIEKIVKSASRLLMQIFIKSKSFSTWCSSIETLCWCGIIIAQANSYLKISDKGLLEKLNEINQVLSLHVDSYDDNTGLLRIFQEEYTHAQKQNEG